MTIQALDRDLRPLRRSFQSARRRLWLQRGILLLARSLCVALGFDLLAALLTGWQAPEPVLRWFWIAGGVAPLVGIGATMVARPSASEAARAVDLRLGLRQQLGTAEELLSRGTNGPLVSMQIARASDLAGGLSMSRAFPLIPRREAIVALLLAAITACLLLLVGMGVTLPNPLKVIRLPSLPAETPRAAEQDPFGSLREADQPKPRSAALDPVTRMMDDLQRQAQRGSLSSAAASAALAQANAELNRVANESRVRQEALDNLANELRGTAAGREAAESLRQGDYSRAAEQLKEMGQQSDQLSPSAKQELANALNRAASRSQGAGDLSKSEKKAADALQQGDYSSVVQSTDQLAKSVQNAANQTVPQSQLAESWQRLDQLNRQLGQPGTQNGDGQNGLSPPVAQAPQRAAERRSDLQQGQQGEQPGQGSGPADGNAAAPAAGQPGSGSPGNSRGGPPLGNQNPRLGPDGKPIDVEGQVAGRFPGQPGSDSESPSVLRQGNANSAPSSVGGGASGPLSVPAENVLVPGDRKPTVRDYFSRGSGGQ